MESVFLKRIPRHVGIIPDGNRRWAQKNGLNKEEGYRFGVEPGIKLFDECTKLGVKEMTFYGFTKDNCKRASQQTKEFKKSCVDAVMSLTKKDCEILVVGDTNSKLFPEELKEFTKRKKFGKGEIKANFLINYSWNWDIFQHHKNDSNIQSSDISRIDLIIRWGNRRRLSGFLPIQSVYSDFYIVDELWPDFKTQHLYKALKWYQDQDITLGG